MPERNGPALRRASVQLWHWYGLRPWPTGAALQGVLDDQAFGRPRRSDRCTSSRYGPKRAWSSHTPRPQNRQPPRADLGQNQQSTYISTQLTFVGAAVAWQPTTRTVDCSGALLRPLRSLATAWTVKDPPEFGSKLYRTGPTEP
jgi:hypothetical protein